MPSIEWEHNGNYRRCDSSDPVVVARFLLEQIALASPGKVSDYTTVRILPMYNRDHQPDWPGTQAKYSFGSQADLSRLAQYVMAWQAERERPLVMDDETETPSPERK